MSRSILLVLLTALIAALLAPPAGAQGNDERRVAINRLPFDITRPGYYYLTGDVVGDVGITIQSADVTLDLNGFEVVGLQSRTSGIEVNVERERILVLDGVVRNWRGHGVDTSKAVNSRLMNVRAAWNDGHGLVLGSDGTITDCSAMGNGINGIVTGARTVVVDSSSRRNVADGIAAGAGATVTNCRVLSNDDDGIETARDVTVQQCRVDLNGADGIEAADDVRLVDNTCQGNGRRSEVEGAGIRLSGLGSVVEGNDLQDNDIGLAVRGRGNALADNEVRLNDTNYDLALENDLKLLVGELPLTIEWPCVATLSRALTGVAGEDGIVVDADDVTLDLAGHTLEGRPGTRAGIVVRPGRRGLLVTDGTLRNWTGAGVDASAAGGAVQVDGLTITGCGLSGLLLGDDADVSDCRVLGNGVRFSSRDTGRAGGIEAGTGASLRDCVAVDNGGSGLRVGAGSTVWRCTTRDNREDGLRLGPASVATECMASGNDRSGIVARPGCTLRDDVAHGNGRDGIVISDRCRVADNECNDNGREAEGAGIRVTGSQNRVEGNTVAGNGLGIAVAGRANVVVSNGAAGNVSDYELGPGNAAGRILDIRSGDRIVIDPAANFVH